MKYPIDGIFNGILRHKEMMIIENKREVLEEQKNIVYPPIYCVTKRVKLRVI